MKLVIIESPYAGDVEQNLEYARMCISDSLRRGEAPFASHLFYTQVLDDSIPEQRRQGMNAGFAWAYKADLIAVYIDLGISSGMEEAINIAKKEGRSIEYRTIARV